MKAFTVKQPWASLIVEPDLINIGFGIKPIENRTWKCPEKYMGERVLVHAGMANQLSLQSLLTVEQLIKVNESLDMNLDFDVLFPKGAIIGSVEIVDCVVNHPSIWAEETETSNGLYIEKPIYNWVLANPIKFDKPIPCKGALSFWEYKGELPI